MAAPQSAPLAAWTTGFVLAGLAATCPSHAAPPAAKAGAAEAACKADAAPTVQYVSPASTRVRVQPRMDADIVATLPIATRLQIECVASGWARARSEGDRPASGWIRTDLLQAQRPELDALIAASVEAKPAERRALAERAVALAPFDARSHQLMIDMLNARKDRKGAQRATTLRDRVVHPKGERLGHEPWTLFAVEDGLVNAVAIVQAAGAGQPLQFHDAAEWTPPGGSANTSPYLLRHRGLHFYRRGGADGVVQILEAPTAEAIGFFAPVRHPPAVARELALDGVASNQVVTTIPAPPAAAPSRAGRGAIDRELRAALKREGLPARTISALLAAPADADAGGVQRVALPASGKPILLATANWRLPAASTDADPPLLDAVLLLEADGKGAYRVTHRLVQQTAGENLAHHVFIDQLDLDQDGVPELLFRVGSHEGSDYEIWRRGDDGWKPVFKGAYVGV